MVKRVILLALLAVGMLMLQACAGGGGNTKLPSKIAIEITPKRVDLEQGTTQEFTVTITGVSNTSVTWKASSGTVEDNGMTITYVAPYEAGSYTLTAISEAHPEAYATATISVANATEEARDTIGPEGGKLYVASGSLVDIIPNILSSPAIVTLKTFTRPSVEYLQGVVPVGNRTQIELPFETITLDSNNSIYIGVPTTVSDPGVEMLAEVRVMLSDKAAFTYLTSYDPVEENVVAISTNALAVYFKTEASPTDTLRIAVQPVDISALVATRQDVSQPSSLAPQATYEFLVYEDLFVVSDSYDDSDWTESCDTEVELVPSSIPRADPSDVPSGKTPLILLHGWQGINDLQNGKSFYNPALCTWRDFLAFYKQDASLSEHYALFSFGYDSSNSIESNADRLAQEIQEVLGKREVVIVAHSMGGVVANAYMKKASNHNVRHLITLGTPYRGSIGLLCTKVIGETCVAVREYVDGFVGAGYFFGINAWAGTRNLAWEFGGINYEVTTLCGPLKRQRCTQTKQSTANPFLVKLNSNLNANKYMNHTSFVGAVPSGDLVMDVVGQILTEKSGLITDGIVPRQSACLSTREEADNVCLHSIVGTTRLLSGFNHNDLKNDPNLENVKKRLLEVIASQVPEPLTPTPLAPSGKITTTTPIFSWTSVEGAEEYGLYISQAPYGPENIIFEQESIQDTSYMIQDNILQDNTNYRFDVRAYRDGVWSEHSQDMYFEVKKEVTVPSDVPLTGTFIQFSSEGTADYLLKEGSYLKGWQRELGYLKALGMDTVVIQYGSYIDDEGTKVDWYKDTRLFDPLFEVAEDVGIDVYLGLAFDERWIKEFDNEVTTIQYVPIEPRLSVQKILIDSFASRYGNSPAFAGWYIPQEISNDPRIIDSTAMIQYQIRPFLSEVSNYARSRRNKPVMVAPYFGTVSRPQPYAAWWDETLEQVDLDIIALQDGVGTGRYCDIDEVLPFFDAFQSVVAKHSRVALWSDLETFNQTRGWPFDDGDSYSDIPAEFTRVHRQFVRVAPYVEKIIIFDFGHMHPDNVTPDSSELYNDYVRYLQNPSSLPAKSPECRVTGIDVEPDTIQLKQYHYTTASEFFKLEGGSEINPLAMTLESSDPNTVSVDGYGTIVAHELGQASIVARSIVNPSVIGELTVVVPPPVVESVEIIGIEDAEGDIACNASYSACTMTVTNPDAGVYFGLKTRLLDEDGTEVWGSRFTSSNPAVASCSPNSDEHNYCTIIGHRDGVATITVYADSDASKNDSIRVTVVGKD